MALKTIFTVGFQLPTKDIFQYQNFHSNASLLDADIILFEPNLAYQVDYLSGTFQGKPSLSDTSSTQCIESVKHWREELNSAFKIGKTIIIFLKEYEEVYYKTGRKEFSGTGRNQKVTNIVDLLDSYLTLP